MLRPYWAAPPFISSGSIIERVAEAWVRCQRVICQGPEEGHEGGFLGGRQVQAARSAIGCLHQATSGGNL